MDGRRPSEPRDEVTHERRYIGGWRRRVDDLARLAAGDEVLDGPVHPGPAFATPNAGDQALVDLADQALRDRLAAVEVLGHQVERLAIVEQLARVVGVRLLHLFACPQLLRLL